MRIDDILSTFNGNLFNLLSIGSFTMIKCQSNITNKTHENPLYNKSYLENIVNHTFSILAEIKMMLE